MDEHKPHLVIRLCFAGVLGFFAFIPTYIVAGAAPSLLASPFSFGMTEYVIVASCIPFAYFLWLLCWRALTWRSNRADGGLMPPVALKLFISAFGVVGAMIVLVSFRTEEYYKIVPGLFYVLIACVAFTSHQDKGNTNNEEAP
ncbi:MAG: hypothetical protein ACR2PS_15555 [Pseudomonadales bacterium]